MKRRIFNICAIALIFCSSCQEMELETVREASLGAYLEETLTTKTTLGTVNDKKYAVWSDGDAIKAFGTSASIKMKTTKTDGTYASFGPIEGESDPGTINYVLYPYQGSASISGSEIKFTLPAVQHYHQDGFADGSNFAVGSVSYNQGMAETVFKNVCGYLKLSLKADNFNVQKIVLMSFKDGEKLNGTFVADASLPEPVAIPYDSGKRVVGDDIITLDCGTGVRLNPSVATDFLFTVPVGALSKGFMATVYEVGDDRLNIDLTTTKSTNEIRRSFIINMPELTVSGFPFSSYDLCAYIQSDGTRIIDTGINPVNGIGLSIKGTMLTAEIDGVSGSVNNPVFCGVMYNTNAPYSPWLTIDYHQSGACRVSFNGANLFPTQGSGLKEPFEVQYAMFEKGKKCYARVNGSLYEVKDSSHPNPGSDNPAFANGNIYLFGANVTSAGTNNKSKSQINYFKAYGPDRKPVRNWIPAKESSTGRYGLYDMVNNVFTPLTGFTFGAQEKLKDPSLVFDEFSIERGEVLGYEDGTLSILVPFGSDVKTLSPTFSTEAERVSVKGVVQTSGETANDFTSPVVYRLENGFSYNEVTVKVTVDEDYNLDKNLVFTTFEVPDGQLIGTIGNTMYVAFKPSASLKGVRAKFTSPAVEVVAGNVTQVSGETALDFSKEIQYTLLGADKKYNHWTVKSMQYDLPVVFVSLPKDISEIDKDNWIKKVSISLFDPDKGTTEYLGVESGSDKIAVNQFRGRGNSSWSFPKKPYTFKLDSKTKVLGMPKAKRWNLLANWMDRTDLRNVVTFRLSEVSPGFAWTPKGKFVELILNGEYNGNYLLTEHIQVDKNRVNITEYDEDAPAPADSVGYLLEFDTNYDEVNKFKSSFNLPVNVKSPDAEGFDLTYIQGFVNSLEQKIKAGDSSYRDSLDIDSFIDWWFIHEMVYNTEPVHPKSSYMWKDSPHAKDNKLHAGPCWDFDWGTFRHFDYWAIKGRNALWYDYLFRDSVFKARLKEKWAAQKDLYLGVADSFIDEQAAIIRNSVNRDKTKWPCTKRENGDETLSFDAAVSQMKNNLKKRINWMDAQIRNNNF